MSEEKKVKKPFAISIGDKVISQESIVDLGTLGCDKCGKMLTCRNGMVLMEAKEFVMKEAFSQGWEARPDGMMFCPDCASAEHKARFQKVKEEVEKEEANKANVENVNISEIDKAILKLMALRIGMTDEASSRKAFDQLQYDASTVIKRYKDTYGK